MEQIADIFFELFRDGGKVRGGFARIKGQDALLVFAEELPDRNGYLKAFRLMEMAEMASVPIVSAIDWTGAASFNGIGEKLSRLGNTKVPFVSVDGFGKGICDAIVPLDADAVSAALSVLSVKCQEELAGNRKTCVSGDRNDGVLDDVVIGPAVFDDAAAIVRSFEPFVLKRLILPRTVEEIQSNIGDFVVAKKDGAIVGTVALRDFGSGLMEIRSLTVSSLCEGRGLGTKLLNAVIDLARSRKASKVFTLTMRPNIFQRLGFGIVSIMRFPGKVQNDCLVCPKKEQCDEVALLLELD